MVVSLGRGWDCAVPQQQAYQRIATAARYHVSALPGRPRARPGSPWGWDALGVVWAGYLLSVEPIPETTEAIEEYGPFGSGDLLGELRAKGARLRDMVPDCVGFSLASIEHGVTFTVAATDADLALLDAVQYLAGGPCVDAVEGEQVVTFTADDAVDERRWQLFAQATAAASVASTLTLPILARDTVAGSVNLYAATRQAFTGLHRADRPDIRCLGARSGHQRRSGVHDPEHRRASTATARRGPRRPGRGGDSRPGVRPRSRLGGVAAARCGAPGRHERGPTRPDRHRAPRLGYGD